MAQELTGVVRASKVLTFSGTGTAADTVTVGKKVYTLATTPTTANGEVKVGASAAATATNLSRAVNLGVGSGTLYGSGTTENNECYAVDGGDGTMTAYARTIGVQGNSIAIAEDGTGASWAGAATVLSGGVGQLEDLLVTHLTILRDNVQLNAQAVGKVRRILEDLAL